MRINSTPGAALLCLAALTTAAAAFNPSSIRHGDFANASKRKSEGAPRIALSMGSLCEDPIALKAKSAAASVFAALSIAAAVAFSPPAAIAADDTGASTAANAKITTGGASTLQSGRTIAITRGVNLDRSDFGGQNLKGVAFQQSIVRDSNFKGCNLVGSSFFDATVDGSDFEGADLTLANFEMAQFNRANLKNAVLREMYVSGATILTGVKDIEGSDWTDTMLRRDQTKYLCSHPTAKGTNPTTGVDTRESLMCID